MYHLKRSKDHIRMKVLLDNSFGLCTVLCRPCNIIIFLINMFISQDFSQEQTKKTKTYTHFGQHQWNNKRMFKSSIKLFLFQKIHQGSPYVLKVLSFSSCNVCKSFKCNTRCLLHCPIFQKRNIHTVGWLILNLCLPTIWTLHLV